MIARLLLVLAVVCLLAPGARASEEEGQKTPKPGLITRTLNIFRRSPDRINKTGEVNPRKIAVRLDLNPVPLKLSETRQLKVTLVVMNHSGKLVHLEFPTTQRIEVLVRNKDGKQVTQWSEDQSFETETTYVAINPNERLEYSVNLATRDMSPGQPYTIEAFFPNYQDLKASKTVTPDK